MAGIVLMTLLLILSGCGQQIGSPGSDSGDTGITIDSVSIVGVDPGAGDNEIDLNIHLCPPDYTTAEKGLFMADATLTINASAAGFDPFPGSVVECTITYLQGEENPEAPPIEMLKTYPGCTLNEGGNECNTTLVTIDRKTKAWRDAEGIYLPSTYPVHYIARYDCTYTGHYKSGDPGKFFKLYDIWLADWDNC